MADKFKDKASELKKYVDASISLLRNKLTSGGVSISGNYTLRELIKLIPYSLPTPTVLADGKSYHEVFWWQDKINLCLGKKKSGKDTQKLFDPFKNTLTDLPMYSGGKTNFAANLYEYGVIFSFGYGGSGEGAKIVLFIPDFNTYTTLKGIDFSLSDHVGITLEKQILYLGGSNNHGRPPTGWEQSRAVFYYDPVTGKRTNKTELPEGGYRELTLIKKGENLLLTAYNRQCVYNYKNDSYTTKEDTKYAYRNHTAIDMNDKEGEYFNVLFAGGNDPGACQIYNEQKGTFTDKRNLPKPLFGHTAIKLKGKILYSGGEASGIQEKQYYYNPYTDEYTS